MIPPAPSFLGESGVRVLFFGGKGGVGKTSCAAATALRLARDSPGSAFLLVSTDPAHSLSDSLAGATLPENLRIDELDSRECLAAFKREHGFQLHEIASRGTFLDNYDINRFLDLSLPGLDELMAAMEIARQVESSSFRTIVVDTAPSGHTLRLLAMPASLKKWIGALDSLLAKHRYMRTLYNVMPGPDALDLFLEGMTRSVEALEALFCDPARCCFVPVMLAEEMSASETRTILHELKQARMAVMEIVVNRLYPGNECPVCGEARARQLRLVDGLLSDRSFAGHPLWGVPLYAQEVRGLATLEVFWAEAFRLPEVRGPSVRQAVPARVGVKAAPPRPGAETTLLLFAGKGGVGKTTLACATSLRLAHDSTEEEVLLFSTDPAHALTACLGVAVGPGPTRIGPSLTALQIDGEQEFSSLKKLYQTELRAFLHSVLPGMDMTFDREAMERIMDLSPPGLDEVMALTQVMDLCEQGRYRTMVLDSAPTGHLIRLLEMPELIDQWLKVFFGLLLKHKQIFRLPKVSARLVEMSKALKRLRVLLADPSRCSLYGVSILTDMAYEETKDLVSACQRMRVDVPVLFLNLATPPSACALCTALRKREAAVEQKYRQAFPAITQTVVERRGELRGLDSLARLGRDLYSEPVENPHP
jgi:arsenite/tail-anchored protein-transporting ATPase